METWRKVWRDGFLPLISTEGLVTLAEALMNDDPRLVQGATTCPPPLMCVQDWPAEGTDSIGWTAWQGGNGPARTVGDVEEHFARLCYEADQRLGEPAACRWFLNWHDDTPRGAMRRELLGEIRIALQARPDARPISIPAEPPAPVVPVSEIPF